MFKNTLKVLQKYSTLLLLYSTPGKNPENTLLYPGTFRKYSTLLLLLSIILCLKLRLMYLGATFIFNIGRSSNSLDTLNPYLYLNPKP